MAKKEVKSVTEIFDRREKVDEFIALYEWFETIKDKIKKFDELKKELLEETDATDSSQQLTIVGDLGQVIYSKGRENTVIVDKAKLIKRLTQKVYNENSEISLKALKELLSGKELKQFTKIERSRIRSLKEVIFAPKM